MRHVKTRRSSRRKRVIEHVILLAFMALTSSILMRAGGNADDVLGQSLIWLAAGEILILFLTSRRDRTRRAPVAARKPVHRGQQPEFARVCESL